MPTINVYTDVDVDVEEFMNECSSYEIEEVINWLDVADKLDDYVSDDDVCIQLPEVHTVNDEIYNDAIVRLMHNRLGLTIDEEEFLLKLSQKFL